MSLLNTPRAYGIDVSDNNGMVNWEAWKGHISFAEIKCSEGLAYHDVMFAQNMGESEDIVDFRFPYHYAHPGDDPSKQAKLLVDLAKPFMKATDHFVLDLEITDELTPREVSFWAWTFCHEVNRLAPGHRIIPQATPSFISAGHTAMLGAWHLWVMDWGVPEPVMPLGPWKSWAFWQYATGAIDRDVYNGSAHDLATFCHHTGPPSKKSP